MNFSKQVAKCYHGQHGDTLALEDMNLTVQDGEFVVVVGPSGCGKTTLLGLVEGFERPSAGMLTMDGQPISEPSHERAVVFQQPTLYLWLTVRQNIRLGLKLRGAQKDRTRLEVDHGLDITGLSDFGEHASYQLFGGMQQRVAISRALLIDEPFGALDANTRGTCSAFTGFMVAISADGAVHYPRCGRGSSAR